MKLKELSLLDMVKNTKFLKMFSKKPTTIFATKHSCIFLTSFINHSDMKYFHITDTTRKRLTNVPTEEISGGKLIDLKTKLSSGLVFFNDGLHFLYLIRNNGVYIMSSRQKVKRFVDDPSFHTGETMSGFLYFDFFSDSSDCYINNLLDATIKEDHLLNKEKELLPILKRLYKELSEGKKDLYDKYNEDLLLKWNDTRLCLQAFMFIHFAKVIHTTRVSEEYDTRSFSEKFKSKKEASTINVIQVDTFYDETMKVINPFSVTGHYRNQPIGKGRSETKLIYIDNFMKSGYTRIATKEKNNV
jgi:hypothetical protein